MGLLSKLQSIDRRIMYLLLALVVAVPLMRKWTLPVAVTPEVRSFYDAVEKTQRVDDKGHKQIAIISIVWASGTVAENGPQTEALMRHFFKKGVPFAILPWDQQGTTLAKDIAERVAKEMGKKYGVDWVHWGYRPAYISQFVRALAKNVPATVDKDTYGTPIGQIPMMKGIKNADNIAFVVEATPSATLESWISFFGQPYNVPIGYCPTAVMVPEGYNYLDAKQIVGMLPGLVGAAQYESLLHYKGSGLVGATALSTSHILIIVLIVLGNLGFIMARRRQEEY
jgi:hypothetical protein